MRARALFAGGVLVAAAALAAVFWPQSAGGDPTKPGNQILARELAVMLGGHAAPERGSVKHMPLSGGVAYTLLQAAGGLKGGADWVHQSDGLSKVSKAQRSQKAAIPSTPPTQGCQNTFSGGAGQTGPNIRVNQDCSRRRQAEEVVVAHPSNSNHLIAGQNDSRIGFNHCGYDWSFDGGRTWGDQVPPFWQYLQPDGHTSDACSDPTATFDADGNIYVGGVIFDVAANANSIIIEKSNASIGGQFYHTPVPGPFQTFSNNPPGIAASDDDPCIFHDKEFVVADAGGASPKKNNVYVTWTRFTCDDSPIVFSQSTDGGVTWSAPVEISGMNAAICTDFSVPGGSGQCDQDQGSHPIVGKDGTIYVAFGNGNTPDFGFNQVLFVKCPASADCSSASSWSAPVKVGDLVGLHPIGPSPEGCPAGRQCLPPNGYRVPEFTSITTSVDNSNRLIVTWADFRNGFVPPCDTLNAATSTPPCNNDVFYAYSLDGGTSWSSTKNITEGSRFGRTAQWQPWSDVRGNGQLYVAYYDRAYGNCEFSGCNDITLTLISNPYVASPTKFHRRVTTASMPNLTPANNPVQAGFLGDYMWVDVDSSGKVHIVWADTRGLNGTVEEDVYYARVE
jgi:hypothetical protein